MGLFDTKKKSEEASEVPTDQEAMFKGLARAVRDDVLSTVTHEMKGMADSLLVRLGKAMQKDLEEYISEMETRQLGKMAEIKSEMVNLCKELRSENDSLSKNLNQKVSDVQTRTKSLNEGVERVKHLIENMPVPQVTFVMPQEAFQLHIPKDALNVTIPKDAIGVNVNVNQKPSVVQVSEKAFNLNVKANLEEKTIKVEPTVVVQPAQKRTIVKSIEYDKDTHRPSKITEQEES